MSSYSTLLCRFSSILANSSSIVFKLFPSSTNPTTTLLFLLEDSFCSSNSSLLILGETFDSLFSFPFVSDPTPNFRALFNYSCEGWSWRTLVSYLWSEMWPKGAVTTTPYDDPLPLKSRTRTTCQSPLLAWTICPKIYFEGDSEACVPSGIFRVLAAFSPTISLKRSVFCFAYAPIFIISLLKDFSETED